MEEAAGHRSAHGVAVAIDIEAGGQATDVGVDGGQFAQDAVGPAFTRRLEQQTPAGGGGDITEGAVVGKDGTGQAAADKLVGSYDVAQPGAVVKHVVPGRWRAAALFREVGQMQVGGQPRGIVTGPGGGFQGRGHLLPDVGQQKGGRRPDQFLRFVAYRFWADFHVDRKRRLALFNPPDQRVGDDPPLGSTGQTTRQPGVAVGRGEHGVVAGVQRLAIAAGEVMQAGPGGGFGVRRAVVVAAGVVGQPAQRRRGVAFVIQPLPEADAIERQPGGIAAGQGHRQRKNGTAIAPAGMFERLHLFREPLLLRPFLGRQPEMGEQALLPQAMAINPLLRRRTQVMLVVTRLACRRTALQHAQFRQQLAHPDRLRAGQRQVVCAPRVGSDRGLASARVAAGFGFHLQHGEVIDAAACQSPRRREAGNAAPDDQDAGAADAVRGTADALAQAMAKLDGGAEEFAGG